MGVPFLPRYGIASGVPRENRWKCRESPPDASGIVTPRLGPRRYDARRRRSRLARREGLGSRVCDGNHRAFVLGRRLGQRRACSSASAGGTARRRSGHHRLHARGHRRGARGRGRGAPSWPTTPSCSTPGSASLRGRPRSRRRAPAWRSTARTRRSMSPPGGTNDVLADAVGLHDRRPLRAVGGADGRRASW